MQIRNRLKTIASLVPKGDYVIDVGCDHALLDIYLTLYNGNTCIASDVNKNACMIAKTNIEKYGLVDKIKVVCSDGFRDLSMKQSYTAVICGMGTSTILSILHTDKIKFLDTIIVQSNNDLFTLRKEITKKGFMITEEKVVKERGIFYVIIRFSKGHKSYSLIDLWLGPMVKLQQTTAAREYLLYMLQNYKQILMHLPKKYVWKRFFLLLKIYILKKELG